MPSGYAQQNRSYPSQGPDIHPLDIFSLVQNPMLRWGDVPGGDVLVGTLMRDPSDPYLLEQFKVLVEEQRALAVMSGDPFHGAYPPRGQLAPLAPGRVPICTLPTGDVLSMPVDELRRNLVLVGPTGAAKTSLLRLIAASLLETQP